MQNNSRDLGMKGEAEARKYLAELGYTIVESNWRYGRLEVDIIATISNTIVFIEVKTRKTNQFGEPETFVSPQKQKLLVAAAHTYLTENEIEREARFDIIAITSANNTTIVKHFESAFYPGFR